MLLLSWFIPHNALAAARVAGLIVYQAAPVADWAAVWLWSLWTRVFAAKYAEALRANMEHNEVFLSAMRASGFAVYEVMGFELLPAVATLCLMYLEAERVFLMLHIPAAFRVFLERLLPLRGRWRAGPPPSL